VYSYACKFVTGRFICINAEKFVGQQVLVNKDLLTTEVEGYILPQHMDIIFACQYAY